MKPQEIWCYCNGEDLRDESETLLFYNTAGGDQQNICRHGDGI